MQFVRRAGEGAVALDRFLEGRQIAGHADHPRTKGIQVSLQDFRGVPLRVDADKNNLHLVAAISELVEHPIQRAQRRRAEIGAVGVTKVNQGGLAADLFQAERRTVGGLERERRGLGDGLIDRAVLQSWLGLATSQGKGDEGEQEGTMKGALAHDQESTIPVGGPGSAKMTRALRRKAKRTGGMSMKYRRLGRSGLLVSELCLGTMQFGWTADEATAHRILDRAVNAGVNFIDTADVYSRWVDGNPGGVAEQIVGNWLAARSVRRDEVILATKVRGRMGEGPNDEGLSRHHILASAQASLRRLP